MVPALSPPLRAACFLGLWPAGLRRTRVGARSRVRGVAPSGGCSPPSPRPPARLPLRGSAPLAPLGPPCPPSAGPLAAFAARPLAFSPLSFGSVRAACPPFAGPLSPLAAPPRSFLAFGSARPAVRRCSALVPRAVGAAAPTPLLSSLARCPRGGGLLPPHPRYIAMAVVSSVRSVGRVARCRAPESRSVGGARSALPCGLLVLPRV